MSDLISWALWMGYALIVLMAMLHTRDLLREWLCRRQGHLWKADADGFKCVVCKGRRDVGDSM